MNERQQLREQHELARIVTLAQCLMNEQLVKRLQVIDVDFTGSPHPSAVAGSTYCSLAYCSLAW